jgi:uncharacterized Zn finger protein
MRDEMATEFASSSCQCPKCGRRIEIENVWDADAHNDYGGFVLECLACGEVFDDYVGRDVRRSSVRHVARLLDRYDEIDANREKALRKHGLSF